MKREPTPIPVHPKETGPFACQYDHFPTKLLIFAEKEGIVPLKWREQNGEYILFSDRFQKYHIPI